MDKLALASHHRPSAADHPPEGQRRFKLTVEYDGTAYCGWQRQINGPSVQAVLEDALTALTHAPVSVTGSSRTDAGVHARGLCAHFDSATRIPPEKLAFALNTMLPADVRIRESGLAPEGFHARFSACGKVYRYAICNARHEHAVGRQYAAHIPLPLDEAAMQREADSLLGTHDFAAFAASGSAARSTVRTIYRAQVSREGDMVTLLVLGGITTAKKICAAAEANDVLVIPHNPLGPVSTAACLQICASIPNLGIQELPGFCINGAEDRMVKEPLRFKDGCILIPEGPGIGIELADDAAELYPANERGSNAAKRAFDGSVKDW